MATDRIFIESFDEAGDAAYRVNASTREQLFAGCGLALSNMILPAIGEDAGTSDLARGRGPANGVALNELRYTISSDRVLAAVPDASLAERSFTLSSSHIDLLLVDFLSELVFLFDFQGFLGYGFELEFSEFEGCYDFRRVKAWDVEEMSPADADDIRLDVHIHGAVLPVSALQPARPEHRVLGLVPKGVSYHMLDVWQGEDERWNAQFVLDA